MWCVCSRAKNSLTVLFCFDMQYVNMVIALRILIKFIEFIIKTCEIFSSLPVVNTELYRVTLSLLLSIYQLFCKIKKTLHRIRYKKQILKIYNKIFLCQFKKQSSQGNQALFNWLELIAQITTLLINYVSTFITSKRVSYGFYKRLIMS